MTVGREDLLNTLREERERLGLTQAGLADLVGVSRKTINTVENGVFIPSTVLALRLAAALDRPVEALFQLAGSSNPSSSTADRIRNRLSRAQRTGSRVGFPELADRRASDGVVHDGHAARSQPLCLRC
ncbi:helix-turn-helix transcriptional regulator [Brytella acorum]|uniref:Helix-turn-helix domain-containing protein n=1 Tax=Brytella acorum TaxID=2959299 RepID=A0AA35Y1E2_9PROT|nr:helix-turn-helix domain-containing protein [Brytella acorum]MDF3623435.1 helix-turn-helix domain-containing protein [Brytella acorum]CAI9120542.1 helix-turn-helix domain-containing protein [Brytella acorum]